MVDTVKSLRQHQLIILRRLRKGPLTEFELSHEVAENSGFSAEQATEKMAGWLEELRAEGVVWSGALTNLEGQSIQAAALTRKGKELVG